MCTFRLRLIMIDRVRCENSTPEVAVSKGKVGGIGLVNIQRRLGLLYPGRYELKQIENENKYTVILSITL